MWTVLNEGFKMQFKVVIANFFTVLGYLVENNSKAIAEEKVSTETSISIRKTYIKVNSDSPVIPQSLYRLLFKSSMLRSNSSIHQSSGWYWPIGVSHGIGK